MSRWATSTACTTVRVPPCLGCCAQPKPTNTNMSPATSPQPTVAKVFDFMRVLPAEYHSSLLCGCLGINPAEVPCGLAREPRSTPSESRHAQQLEARDEFPSGRGLDTDEELGPH